MKYLFVLIFNIITLPIWAQGTFTEAFQRFRPYHYQTPSAWNRIRCEVATNGKVKWPMAETERREMELVGGWHGLLPAPKRENTHFFKQIDEMGKIYNLMLTPDAYGYVVYPFVLEEQFKLSENELLASRIEMKGFMNTLITDVTYETEQKLDEMVYVLDTTQNERETPPEVYNEDGSMGWLREADYYDLYNVKNFYCYFDNRPDSVRYRMTYTTHVTPGFPAEVERLTQRMQKSHLAYAMIPYWMTDVYLQVPTSVSSRMKRFGYPGYIINPVNGASELMNSWNMPNVMDYAPYKDIPFDLVAYSGDAISTNRFLSNREAQRRFIYNVFNYPNGMLNRKGSAHKPNGLNLYMPAFDFSEKRALTQLVKSISLVIDSLNVSDSVHIYENIDFSLTFGRKTAREHSGFISGLQCFVDTVYFADFDSLGLAPEVIYNNGSIDTSNVITRIINPFYLFRIPFKTIQPGVNDGDIRQLMDCDYASGQWGLFFCIDLCLVLLLIALLVLRYTSVEYNIYISKFSTFIVLLTITLLMEFGVFFFFMIEALSPQVIYFDLETGSLTYLTLIALPVLPILLYFVILQLNKREPIP